MSTIRDLQISDTLTIPIEIATRKTSIIAKSDAGKSYTLRKIAELIIGSGFAIAGALFDPLGVAYGLRFGPDGESAGLSVPIFGGPHGDVPLTVSSAARIARALIESKTIGILDLSQFDDEEQWAFVGTFAKAVAKILSESRQPFWLGMDEADMFAPETPAKGQAECQRAVRYYCRRVRNFGGGYTFATQSTSVIDKKVVGQSDLIIAMHITSPTDQKPVIDWLKAGVGDKQATQLVRELASFHRGDALFYSPSWLRKVERAHIARCETFDSSKTPEIGEVIETVGRGAAIDLDALRNALEVEETSDDRDELVARIHELEAELNEVSDRAREQQSVVETVSVFTAEDRELLSTIETTMRTCQSALDGVTQGFKATWNRLDELMSVVGAATAPVPEVFEARPPVSNVRKIAHEPARSGEVRTSADSQVSGPDQKFLIALYRRGRAKTTRRQLGALAGYSPKSSTFANYLSSLRTRGLITVDGQLVAITDAGVAAIGGSRKMNPVSQQEMIDSWCEMLGGKPAAMLRILAAQYPRDMTRSELAERSGLSPTSSTFSNYLSELRTNQLAIVKGSVVKANAEELLL